MKPSPTPVWRSRRSGFPLTPAALLLCVAGVSYNDWVLEYFLPTGLDPRHSYVSELYAADQPFRGLFGAIEISTATAVILGALLARRTAPGRLAALGWWALVGFGACSVADVLLPMSCAPSIERGCEAVHPWHTATSALVHFMLFASMALLIRASAAPAHYLPPVARWGRWVLPTAMASAIATVGPLLGHPGWQGVPQRIHLLLAGSWLVLLGTGLPRPAALPAAATRAPAG
ncbi:DUF998 domain-containing protein [Kitasatospora sp. NPDC052896]|uniref:DUF998 domain-containing protein n=1 Tax=Kitasatospora sp. NPDC052896 TaxID=3364061 RepID=UPI0037C96772